MSTRVFALIACTSLLLALCTAPTEAVRRRKRPSNAQAAAKATKGSVGPGSCPVQDPDFVAVSDKGSDLFQQGNFKVALDCFNYAATLHEHPMTYGMLGSIHTALGDNAAAVAAFKVSMGLSPHPATANNYAIALINLKKHKEAIPVLERGLLLDGKMEALHINLGLCYNELRKSEQAESVYRKALSQFPDSGPLNNGFGLALYRQNKFEEALSAWTKLAEVEPTATMATQYNIANCHNHLKRYEIACTHFEAAARLAGDSADAGIYNNWGLALHSMGRYEEAIEKFDRSARIDPMYADAYVNWASSLKHTGKPHEAITKLDLATKISPHPHPRALNNLGVLLSDVGAYTKAIDAYSRAVVAAPSLVDAFCGLVQALVRVCAWTELEGKWDDLVSLVEQRLEKGIKSPIAPLHALAYPPFTPELVARIATSVAREYAAEANFIPSYTATHSELVSGFSEGERVRVGYVTGDLGDHPVSYLYQEVLCAHDSARFEIRLYAFNADDGSSWREKMVKCADRFVDVSSLSLADASQAIADDKNHILIDISGLTDGGARLHKVLSTRPAPLQLSMLGYAATTGASYIDYYVCDVVACPPDSVASQFVENMLYLPRTYLPNSHSVTHAYVRNYDTTTVDRSALGLPPRGSDTVIYASFNQLYKVNSQLFNVWCRILKRVPNSVLWLLALPAQAESRLRAAAVANGITSDRIVFTKLLPKDEHVGQKAIADVFLDTFPYGAHSTAVDTLWAGVPLITFPTGGMAGRVAASLLNALGMHELVASTVAEYEDLAVRLGSESEFRSSVREKLETARDESGLFDTARWVSELESGLETLWQGVVSGSGSEKGDVWVDGR